MSTHYMLSSEHIFTFLFVMLGPLRILGPFAMLTATLTTHARLRLALQSTLIATIALITAGFLGGRLLIKWQVSPYTLLLGGGILFFLIALRSLIVPTKVLGEGGQSPKSPSEVAMSLILTPYGIATVIVLLAVSHDQERTITILKCIFSVMALNVLSMGFGSFILKTIGQLPLKILGTSVGVMQLALALQIIITSMKAFTLLGSLPTGLY